MKNISLRSLKWIKIHYKDFLNIELSKFNHEQVPFYAESCFDANNVWEGVNLLSRIRNEIAHTGKCTEIDICHLVDAYSMMEFSRYWVQLFHLNYGSKN